MRKTVENRQREDMYVFSIYSRFRSFKIEALSLALGWHFYNILERICSHIEPADSLLLFYV